MKNILLQFFKSQKNCSHKNALINCDIGYCPDCGEYLEKNYYIIRCARCDKKRQAKYLLDNIVPIEKYCAHCGESSYIVEKIDKINFVDVNFAICLKEPILMDLDPTSTIWVEEDKRNAQIKKIAKLN